MRVVDDYFDPVRGLLTKIGVIKRDPKKPFNRVPNDQTKIHTPK